MRGVEALLPLSTGTGIRVKRLQQWACWGEQSGWAETRLLAMLRQQMGAGRMWSVDHTWVSYGFHGQK